MSIIRRRRGQQDYLYFQYYDSGKKIEEYIGPADNVETWKAWERTRRVYESKFSDWLENRLSELDKTVASATGLDRRRLEVPETAPVTPTIPEIPESFGFGRSLRTSRKNKTKGKRPNK